MKNTMTTMSLVWAVAAGLGCGAVDATYAEGAAETLGAAEGSLDNTNGLACRTGPCFAVEGKVRTYGRKAGTTGACLERQASDFTNRVACDALPTCYLPDEMHCRDRMSECPGLNSGVTTFSFTGRLYDPRAQCVSSAWVWSYDFRDYLPEQYAWLAGDVDLDTLTSEARFARSNALYQAWYACTVGHRGCGPSSQGGGTPPPTTGGTPSPAVSTCTAADANVCVMRGSCTPVNPADLNVGAKAAGSACSSTVAEAIWSLGCRPCALGAAAGPATDGVVVPNRCQVTGATSNDRLVACNAKPGCVWHQCYRGFEGGCFAASVPGCDVCPGEATYRCE